MIGIVTRVISRLTDNRALPFSNANHLACPVIHRDGFPSGIDEWKKVINDICTDDANVADMIDVIFAEESSALEFIAEDRGHFRRVALNRRIQELPPVFHLAPRVHGAADGSAIGACAAYRFHVCEVKISSFLRLDEVFYRHRHEGCPINNEDVRTEIEYFLSNVVVQVGDEGNDCNYRHHADHDTKQGQKRTQAVCPQ